jgi:hypothetical protein
MGIPKMVVSYNYKNKDILERYGLWKAANQSTKRTLDSAGYAPR